MSTVTYRHDNNYSFKKGGVKHVIKENIIDGEKGLSFHFLKKVGDKDFQSISVREVENDKFSVRVKKGENEPVDTEVDMKELSAMIKKDANLKFVDDFLKSDRGSYKGRKSRRGKRTSKKSWPPITGQSKIFSDKSKSEETSIRPLIM